MNTIPIYENINQKISEQDPLYSLLENEFENVILKFGSFISIINNKKINQTTFLICILNPQ